MSAPKPAVCVILVRKVARQKFGFDYQVLLVRPSHLFKLMSCTEKVTDNVPRNCC